MFTGIVQGIAKIVEIKPALQFTTIAIDFDPLLIRNLQIGASVAINGVCLTATSIQNEIVTFDLISETLSKTNLRHLNQGDSVNMERAARFGDEIGGHILSGHVMDYVTLLTINRTIDLCVLTFQTSAKVSKYLFPKGYVALNGVSLTLVKVDSKGIFSVHLIPETLRKTTFGSIKEGDLVNIEVDAQTQATVDTLEQLT